MQKQKFVFIKIRQIHTIKAIFYFIVAYFQDLHIKLMRLQKNKEERKKLSQSFNQNRIQDNQFVPVTFDPKLASNPFLKDQQQFHYLIHRLKEYNKLVLSEGVTDRYQMMVYAKLFSLMGVIGALHTKQDQIEKLSELYEWFIKQEKLVVQRKDQGDVRYKSVSHEQALNASPQPSIKRKRLSLNPKPGEVLPSELISQQSLPFEYNWRTAHPELDTADKRIKEYKRKLLKLQPLQEPKEDRVLPRIIYPKLGKYNWVKEYEVQEVEGEQPNIQNPQSIIENGQKPAQEGGQNKPQEPAAVEIQQPGQDLGLGQEPQQQQPEEEEEAQQIDKLAPRLKSFIFEPRKQNKHQQMSHKRMNERYLKLQNDFVKKQNEDGQFVKLMHDWGTRKSKIQKDIIRRIQDLGVSPRYSLSFQAPPKQERINPEDEVKYGLTKTMPIREVKPTLDMSTDFTLPQIKKKSMYEKTIRNDRLNSLKKKFGAMLNLKETQERQASSSLCKCAPKRFGFSEILDRHSKDKERQIQLDEITTIKQKLARSKVNIDARTLSMSMCVPEDEQNLPVDAFPMKDLPVNPFWVEPAKKKKKKKK